jgi:hypothetical protein
MGTANKKQGARQITEEQWDKLLDSFRESAPPVRSAATAAAKAAGVSRKTAVKAWGSGVAYLGKEPIRDTILEEQMAARAGATDALEAAAREQTQAQADRAYAEAEKARADVIRARRQEGEMVRAQRGNLVAMIGITGTILRGAIKQARELEKALATGKDPATGKALTIREKITVLWQVNRIVAQTANASSDVIKMERLLLGEPTEIVGHMDLGDMTEEQALADIFEAYQAAQRVQARRESLTVIHGGKANGKANGASNGKANGSSNGAG